MLQFAWLLAVVVGAVGLVAAHLALWRWFFTVERVPDERHFITTADGWRLALGRFRPQGAAAHGTPVICAPGLACNSRLFDFADDLSLARTLASEGFDVWLLDLRGTGASERAGLLAGHGWGYGFMEYATQDAPAAIGHVRAITGQDQVLWVGHSMGGLIGYHAATHAQVGPAIAGVVALGSPADFADHRRVLGRALTWILDVFLRGWPVVRLGRLGTLVAPLAGHVRVFPEHIFLSIRNTAPGVLRRFLVEVLEDVPRRLLDQFADNIVRELGFDGDPVQRTYERLGQATVPLLSVAGNADRVAPPRSVHAAVDLLGSEDCTELTVGADDAELDFGHLDLLLGRRAPQVVYPAVVAWCRARSAATASGSAPSAAAADSTSATPG
ncbi:MAG: alpha/beta fold hydrolase [Myxococcales bacterium]|nr:alpha/beta fold hydrolase [Myxococcales bacterium]